VTTEARLSTCFGYCPPGTTAFTTEPRRTRRNQPAGYLRALRVSSERSERVVKGCFPSELFRQGFGDGYPVLFRGGVGMSFGDEQGVDRGKGRIEPVEVDDRVARQGSDPLEIERAEIDRFCTVQLREEGEAVGEADEGPGGVEQAAPSVQERAGAIGRCASGAGADMLGPGGGSSSTAAASAVASTGKSDRCRQQLSHPSRQERCAPNSVSISRQIRSTRSRSSR